jgi:3-hydroxyisobutyrate dehydrogenase/2-hydroxy-3-oxopropionate reductase
MAKHLAKHGYTLTVCDTNADNAAKAGALGATVVNTPAEVGKNASFVILGVGYDDEVNAVTLGAEGVLGTLSSGAIIAVSSTVMPDTVKALDAKARQKGIDVLDAPICRGRWFADEGKLLALFGGKPDVVTRGRAVYGTFCSDIAALGEVGHGQVGKAMNNLLLWITSIGLIEAGRIAETTGIDLPTLRDALQMSSGKSQALEDWDQTSFMWALKDMQIVSKMADAAGLSLPVTGAVKELVKEAKRIKATNPPKWTATK